MSNAKHCDHAPDKVRVKRSTRDKVGDKKGVYPEARKPMVYAPVSAYRSVTQLSGRMGSVKIVSSRDGLATKAVANVNSLPANGYSRQMDDRLTLEQGYKEDYRKAAPLSSTWSGTRFDPSKHAKGLRKLGK